VLGRPYNEKSDIWSLGCLVFELAALVPPFEASSKPLLEQRIKSGVHGRLPLRYSAELNNAISGMLCVDSRRRASVDDVLRLPQVAMRARHVVSSAATTTTTGAIAAAAVAIAPQPPPQQQQQQRQPYHVVNHQEQQPTTTTTAMTGAPVALLLQPPPNQTAEAAALALRARELDARERELNARERSIEARERDLARREAELLRCEQQLLRQQPPLHAAVPRGLVYRTASAGTLAAKENSRPSTGCGVLYPLAKPL